jgi:hypothetical protein
MPGPPSAPVTISFRHLLTDVIEAFLAGEGMSCPDTAEALGELVVTLARYREEGASLFPLVFLCDDRRSLQGALGGLDLIDIGQGPRAVETMRRAIKLCAPLGRGGWSIFVERRAGVFLYGLFRTDGFVLRETPMELLRRTADPAARLIGLVQLADNVLELRGGSGSARLVYLSGARADTPPMAAVGQLIDALVQDVADPARPGVRTFFRRVLIEVLRAPHGSLIAVAPAHSPFPALFLDGARLPQALSVEEAVVRYEAARGEEERAHAEGLAGLLLSMIGSDGITLLGSDGSLLGFNQFLHHESHPGHRPIGGARRRTYEALVSQVGSGLLAAFYRSQDGAVECAVAPAGGSVPRPGGFSPPTDRSV